MFYVSSIIWTVPRKVPENKQIVNSKDAMKDRQSQKKLCYFKYRLTYTNRNSKITFLYISLKKWGIRFVLLRKLRKVCDMSIKSIAEHIPGNEVKCSQNAWHYI